MNVAFCPEAEAEFLKAIAFRDERSPDPGLIRKLGPVPG
jgi:hypothetical protein